MLIAVVSSQASSNASISNYTNAVTDESRAFPKDENNNFSYLWFLSSLSTIPLLILILRKRRPNTSREKIEIPEIIEMITIHSSYSKGLGA